MSEHLNLTSSEYELINAQNDSFTLEYQSEFESEGQRQWMNRCDLLEMLI
jgi:hypothetical protein